MMIIQLALMKKLQKEFKDRIRNKINQREQMSKIASDSFMNNDDKQKEKFIQNNLSKEFFLNDPNKRDDRYQRALDKYKEAEMIKQHLLKKNNYNDKQGVKDYYSKYVDNYKEEFKEELQKKYPNYKNDLQSQIERKNEDLLRERQNNRNLALEQHKISMDALDKEQQKKKDDDERRKKRRLYKS